MPRWEGIGKILQPNPGSEWTDLSSASFYAVNVVGRDGIKVQYGKETVSPKGDRRYVGEPGPGPGGGGAQ